MPNPIEAAPSPTPEPIQSPEQHEAPKKTWDNAFFIDDTPLLAFPGIRGVIELESTAYTALESEMQNQHNHRLTRAEARSVAAQERAAETPFVNLCNLLRERIADDEHYSQLGPVAATSELLGPHVSFMRPLDKEQFISTVGTLIKGGLDYVGMAGSVSNPCAI